MTVRTLRRRARRAAAAAAALLVACGEPGSTAATPFDLLITDVQVVDVDAAAVLPDRTVAVRGGEIAAVWAESDVPAGVETARRIEGEGRWVIPGLWDAHVHFRGGEELREENRALLALYPAFGVTTVRDAGGDLTPALLAWRDSIAAGALVGPHIFTSGPKLDGPRPSWDGSIALSSPDQVPAAVDSLEAVGVDYVKLYDGTMSPEVFLAGVREAEARGLTVTGHMPLGVDFLEAVEAGLDGTDHLYYVYKGTAANREEITARVRAGELGFWDAFWVMLGQRDPEREAEVFAAMVRTGTAVVPTLHIGEVLSTVELVDHSGDAMLRRIPPGIRETYAGRVRSAERASLETRENNRRLRVEMTELLGRMHAAGVTVMAGSDAGPFNSYTYPGEALHAELEALVAAGLTPAEVLRSATTTPAAFLGVGDRVGRIAPGYRADLVLLEADPLADIAAVRTRSTVVLRGETVLDRADLDTLPGGGG